MKHKLLLIILFAFVVLGYFVYRGFNNSYAIEYMGTAEWYKDYTYSLNNTKNTITLTKYNGNSVDVVVQNSALINNIKYNTIISESVFANNEIIKTVNFENGIKGETSLSYLFVNCINLKSVVFNDFDISNTTNMQGMFSNCKSIQNIDVSSLNTSNVINMNSMFFRCESLTSLDLSNFNTTNVTNIGEMFTCCFSLKYLDISNFNLSNLDLNSGFPFNRLDSIETIKLGDNFKFYNNDNFIGSFGRGTWKRIEDQKEYSVVELIRKSETESIAGTYTKVSSISDEMSIGKQVTFKLVNLDTVTDYNLSSSNLSVVNDTVYLRTSIRNASERVLSEKISYKIVDSVEDKYGNKYDILVKVNDIHFNNIVGASTSKNVIIALVSKLTFQNYIYDTFENAALDQRLSGIGAEEIVYNIELQILDKNGVQQEGSYIFTTIDIDGNIVKSYNGRIYSEGVNLVSGFDLATLKFSNPTNLVQENNIITSIRGDNSTELSEFLVKADSKSTVFKWYAPLGWEGGLNLLYQPELVKIKNRNTVESCAIYDKEDNKLVEWEFDDEVYNTMLSSGLYVLRCENSPGYKKPDDIEFSIREKIYQNSESVSEIEIPSIPNKYEYTINYVDKRTNNIIKTDNYIGDYNSIIKSEDYIISIPKYIYDSVDKNEMTIDIDSTNNIINIYYINISEGVIEKHIDIHNDNILYNELHEGNVGDEYNILSREFNEYDLVEEKVPNNAKGLMTEEVIEVIYYYKKKTNLTVKYVDIETEKSIIDDEIINGYIDEQYETKAKDIKNYKYVKSSENTKGIMRELNSDVIYYYEKIVSSPQTDDYSHLYLWIGLIILSVITIIIVIKKVK